MWATAQLSSGLKDGMFHRTVLSGYSLDGVQSHHVEVIGSNDHSHFPGTRSMVPQAQSFEVELEVIDPLIGLKTDVKELAVASRSTNIIDQAFREPCSRGGRDAPCRSPMNS